MTALDEAATQAPAAPGVYFFLGTRRELLYVGKAGDLRRRLRDHARGQMAAVGRQWGVPLERVRTVRWELCGSEDAALAREADLIVALRPLYNASHTDLAAERYVSVAGPVDGWATFELTDAPRRGARVYGSFPHLAKGAASQPAKRMKAGYTALLRLLWVAQGGDRAARIPGPIAGPSPPVTHSVPVPEERRRGVHALLSGRAAGVIDRLGAAVTGPDIPPFMRPNLERDVAAVRSFFDLGPRRLRQFRLRHHLPRGPVAGTVLADRLAAEVREVVGEFTTIAPVLPGEDVLGRRWAARQPRRRRADG